LLEIVVQAHALLTGAYSMLWRPRVSTLILIAWLAGCGSPPGFGTPAVLARNEGEARMLQGRKPMWIKVDPQT
jgi:hypothetical protein